jgi:hypothetical protein
MAKLFRRDHRWNSRSNHQQGSRVTKILKSQTSEAGPHCRRTKDPGDEVVLPPRRPPGWM